MPSLNYAVSEAISNTQERFFSTALQYIDKHKIPLDKIEQELISDGAYLKIHFPYEEELLGGVGNPFCCIYSEYPQFSGLADERIQNRLNLNLKNETLLNLEKKENETR